RDVLRRAGAEVARLAVRIGVESRQAGRRRAAKEDLIDAGVSVVVRSPDEGRATLEDADSAAELLFAGVADVPVESDARLPGHGGGRDRGRREADCRLHGGIERRRRVE